MGGSTRSVSWTRGLACALDHGLVAWEHALADSVSDSIVVDAGPDAVWGVIADFDAYPEWNDEITSAEVLNADEDGWGTRVRFEVDAGVIGATFTLAYTYTDDSMSWWLVEGDKLRKNDGTYRLEERDDGTTVVTYELEIEAAVPLPGLVKRQAARRIVTRALSSMRDQAEGA